MMDFDSILTIDNLTIGYQRTRKSSIIVAEKINLSLEHGQLVCLLGPNGIGKSTLVRTIAGLQKPLSGCVLLNGEDIHQLSVQDLATRLSVVLTDRPDVGLLSGYALVALGRHPYTDWTGQLSAEDEAVIRWAVDAVGATDIAHQAISEMSDGQKQKMMIARALAQEPELMLLDEPTAFLDLPRRVEMMQLLRHLAHDTQQAILITTHDLDLALRTADTLWLMSADEICIGSPEDLVLNGAFEKAFEVDGVQFDQTTGTFVFNHIDNQQNVAISGEGVRYIWTKRALQRAGFTVSDNGYHTSELRIKITESAWQVKFVEDVKHCQSLADVIQSLRDFQAS